MLTNVFLSFTFFYEISFTKFPCLNILWLDEYEYGENILSTFSFCPEQHQNTFQIFL